VSFGRLQDAIPGAGGALASRALGGCDSGARKSVMLGGGRVNILASQQKEQWRGARLVKQRPQKKPEHTRSHSQPQSSTPRSLHASARHVVNGTKLPCKEGKQSEERVLAARTHIGAVWTGHGGFAEPLASVESERESAPESARGKCRVRCVITWQPQQPCSSRERCYPTMLAVPLPRSLWQR